MRWLLLLALVLPALAGEDLDALRAGLKEKDLQKRRAVFLKVVGLLAADGEAFDFALDTLVDHGDDPAARFALLSAIAGLDPHAEDDVISMACMVVAEIGKNGEMYEGALEPLLTSATVSLRPFAACALIKTRRLVPEALETLKALLAHEDREIVAVTVTVVSALGADGRSLVESLRGALSRTYDSTRVAVAGALMAVGGKTQWSTARLHLLNGLRSKDEQSVAEAVDGLGYARAVALKDVRKLLDDHDAHVRRNACRALGAMGEPDSIEALRRLRKDDPDPTVRKHAAKALAEIDEQMPFKQNQPGGAVGLGGGGPKEKDKKK